jgi:hypothetical protein
MTIELTAEELALLRELLESAQKDLHVEIRRTETSAVKEEMRGRDALISSLLERTGARGPAS